MCGVIGIYSKKPLDESHLILFSKLMEESSIRGLHSFGISLIYDNKLKTIKSDKLDIDLFISEIKKSETNKVIFHNRYSTSGDYKDMKNNQPVFTKDTALVMNGVLSMKTKDEYEKEFNVKCEADNDAEIFLHLIEKGKSINDVLVENKNCSFAGIFLSIKELFAIRNNKRPLYIFEYNGATFIVSTKDIAERSGFNGIVNPIDAFNKILFKDNNE